MQLQMGCCTVDVVERKMPLYTVMDALLKSVEATPYTGARICPFK